MLHETQLSAVCRAVIRAALQGSAGFLFSSLSPSETDALVMSMAERVLAVGETIIKQGDVGDHFYIVESGTFDIFVNDNRVASRGPGDSFGELALLYNCPRAATVRATSASRVWALDRITFRYMIASTRDAQLGEIVRGLRAVELLKKLSEEQVNRVAEAVQIKTYKKGELIIRKVRTEGGPEVCGRQVGCDTAVSPAFLFLFFNYTAARVPIRVAAHQKGHAS